jgi:hypothetical protein
MSDFNPLTGSSSPFPVIQSAPKPSAPKPQVVFEDKPQASPEEEVNSDEAIAFQRLAERAGNTKFATGNRDVDIQNYLKMKAITKGLLSFLGDEE